MYTRLDLILHELGQARIYLERQGSQTAAMQTAAMQTAAMQTKAVMSISRLLKKWLAMIAET